MMLLRIMLWSPTCERKLQMNDGLKQTEEKNKEKNGWGQESWLITPQASKHMKKYYHFHQKSNLNMLSMQ